MIIYLNKTKTMDKTTFTALAENHIEQLQNLINQMPYKGDTCSESQKLCLQQALNELEHNVNGVEEEDLNE